MGLIKENVVEQGVKDSYDCLGLPFVLVSLQMVDTFFQAVICRFGDKFAPATALKNLQACKMGLSSINK
ncbi:hypothetical protein CROQUDRAFT_668286 [Cronartium quercuum f. sp. fusiforme G11]|uniref:Uncharacterized protein n=1 Tax=Cronartium quercuum f. sp. fusiforme G11 TaxID=708437 RepID=A0A9P6NV56_9BASI|nr:hypothetical protein CROQUDRAFT_668286 [Cronartium quercuum f. sp. fusiforme G11]